MTFWKAWDKTCTELVLNMFQHRIKTIPLTCEAPPTVKIEAWVDMMTEQLDDWHKNSRSDQAGTER